MKAAPLICFALIATTAAANAQAPTRRPDQFYTNGEAMNAWTATPQQRGRTTFWFARNPADSAAYRQMLAIIYDDQPDQVFYIDTASRLFVGRLDLKTDQFSLLAKDARRARLPDIDPAAFSAPGELPRVADLFDPLPAGERGNSNRLALPPPTPKFPRLKNSVWETNYMAANRERIRSTLELQNDRGTYRLTDRPGTGRLTDIQYESQADGHVIHGNWSLGNSSGWFKFHVPEDNLNVFWGEFGFEPGHIVGAWDGFRKSQPALKESRNRIR